MSMNELHRHRREFLRALANKHYEVTGEGLLFPRQHALIGGHFLHDVNGHDERIDHNLLVDEGINHVLDVALHNQAQTPTWYVALFSGNVTPAANWTGANFVANATEFTNYAEASRREWVEGAAANKAIDNLSSKAAFTIGAGGGTIWGAALLSNSVKQAVTGVLLAASKFSVARAPLETDVLNIGYALSMSST